MTKIVIAIILLTWLTETSVAKEWRGIIPLHSKRADVRRLFGEPLFDENSVLDIYDVDEGRINVMYVVQKCQKGLPSNWGNWNVAPGTVVDVTVHLKDPVRLADLKISDIEKYKWYTDDSMTTYYQDKKQGIEYSVQDGMVTSITHGPTEGDEALLCNKNAPKIKY